MESRISSESRAELRDATFRHAQRHRIADVATAGIPPLNPAAPTLQIQPHQCVLADADRRAHVGVGDAIEGIHHVAAVSVEVEVAHHQHQCIGERTRCDLIDHQQPTPLSSERRQGNVEWESS